MFDVKNVEIEWAGRKLKLETGKIARQADSTVIATYGGTTVMCNVVAAKEANPDMDFSLNSKLSRKILFCRKNTWWFF